MFVTLEQWQSMSIAEREHECRVIIATTPMNSKMTALKTNWFAQVVFKEENIIEVLRTPNPNAMNTKGNLYHLEVIYKDGTRKERSWKNACDPRRGMPEAREKRALDEAYWRHIRPLYMRTPCVDCGADDGLDLDHVSRSRKDIWAQVPRPIEMENVFGRGQIATGKSLEILKQLHVSVVMEWVCKRCHIDRHKQRRVKDD